MMCVMLEIEIVDDGGELVGGVPSARASVVPASRIDPSASRTAPASSASARRLGVALDRLLCRIGPSSHADPEPGEIGAGSPPHLQARVRSGSVSSIRSTSAPPCSSANVRLATALSAFPRWSDPVGLGAKRTRTGRLTRRS